MRPERAVRLVPSMGDAAAWCSAASAGLRSIPLLAQCQVPAAKFVRALLELASSAGSAATFSAGDGTTASSTAAAAEGLALLMEAVWDLHTRAVRLAHIVAAGGAGAALQLDDPDRQTTTALLDALSGSMAAAVYLSRAQAAAPGGLLKERATRWAGAVVKGGCSLGCAGSKLQLGHALWHA